MLGAPGASEPALEHGQQLGQRHARWGLLVVAEAPAAVGHHEVIAGREQRLEEGLTVIGAVVAVADSGLVDPRPVEAQPRAAAREAAVVHPEQADDPERQAAHRHHGAEGHPPRQEGHGGPARVERRVEQRAERLDLDRVVVAGVRRPGDEVVEHVEDRLGPPGGVVVVDQEVGDERRAAIAPRRQGARLAQGVEGVEEALEVVDDLPGDQRVLALDVVVGAHPREALEAVVGQGVPEQEPLEGEAPGVERVLGLPVARPVRGVAPPPRPRLREPGARLRQLVGADPDGVEHGRQRQEREHRARLQPPGREIEELEEGLRPRVRPLQAQVVDLVQRRKAALPFGGVPVGEHGVDQRREGVDVGREDHDVARLEGRVPREEAEQGVPEDLDLPHCTMADMDLHRAIFAIHHEWFRSLVFLRMRARRPAIAQQEHVFLQCSEGGLGPRGDEAVVVARSPAEPVEEALQVAPEAIEGGEQRVSEAWVLARGDEAVLLAPGGRGAGQEEVDLAVARDGPERLDVAGREGVDAEHHDPTGHPGQRALPVGVHGGDEGREAVAEWAPPPPALATAAAARCRRPPPAPRRRPRPGGRWCSDETPRRPGSPG